MTIPQTHSYQMLTADEEIKLITSWIETRDQKLLVKLINAFEPLVLKFVRRFASYGIPKEELFSVGNLALVEVANRFKPELGLKFSTYASHWVRGTMLAFIVNNYFSFTMKSQKMKKVFFRLRSLIHKEQKRNGTVENSEEIMQKMAIHFGIDQQQLEMIYQMIRQPNVSFDEPIRIGDEGESATFGDMIRCENPDPEQSIIAQSIDDYRHELIQSAMDRVLNARERIIVEGQLLMEEDSERTLQDLADEFKLSRERVRQIRNNAFSKLEKAIRRDCAHKNTKTFL